MELRISKRYPVASTPEQAWAVLGDLAACAACMPGAELGEPLGENRHRGLVRAKVGPASLAFEGEVELLERDDAAKRIALLAKGADKAGSAATMQLSAHIEASGDGQCTLVGEAQVKVSGKLVQIGQRLLLPASDALLAQFAAHFNTAAAAVAPGLPMAAPAPAAPLSVFGLLLAMLRRLFGRG